MGARIGGQPRDGGGGEIGRIDRDHDDGRGGGGCQGPEARAQGRRDTLGPVVGHSDARAGGNETSRLVGGRAEHDDDRVAAAVAERTDGLLDPGNTVGITREGLGAAEAPPGPGGENEPRGQPSDGVAGGLGGHDHDSVACAKHGADTLADMLELAGDLLPVLDAGMPVAAVTVTRVVRSAPRGVARRWP